DHPTEEPPPEEPPSAGCPDPSTLPRAVRGPDGEMESYEDWSHRASDGNPFPAECALWEVGALCPLPMVGETYGDYFDDLLLAAWAPPEPEPKPTFAATWDG